VLAKSVAESIRPLDGEIGVEIADLVHAMQAHGFETVSSCEGIFGQTVFGGRKLMLFSLRGGA
jgi:hypothetical protein